MNALGSTAPALANAWQTAPRMTVLANATSMTVGSLSKVISISVGCVATANEDGGRGGLQGPSRSPDEISTPDAPLKPDPLET